MNIPYNLSATNSTHEQKQEATFAAAWTAVVGDIRNDHDPDVRLRLGSLEFF